MPSTLAEATGVQAPAFRRVMRTLVGLGCLLRTTLIASHQRRSANSFKTGVPSVRWCPAALFSAVRARRRSKACSCTVSRPVKPGQVLFGTDWIGHLQKDSDRTQLFNAMMTFLTLASDRGARGVLTSRESEGW